MYLLVQPTVTPVPVPVVPYRSLTGPTPPLRVRAGYQPEKQAKRHPSILCPFFFSFVICNGSMLQARTTTNTVHVPDRRRSKTRAPCYATEWSQYVAAQDAICILVDSVTQPDEASPSAVTGERGCIVVVATTSLGDPGPICDSEVYGLARGSRRRVFAYVELRTGALANLHTGRDPPFGHGRPLHPPLRAISVVR